MCSELGQSHQRNIRLGLREGQIPSKSRGLRVGEVPQRRILAPVELPRKARRHVCIGSFDWGNPHSGVYMHDPSSGENPISRGITFLPTREGIPISRAYGWMDRCRNRLRVGDIPSMGGSSYHLRVEKIPSTGRVDGWMDVVTTSEWGISH